MTNLITGTLLTLALGAISTCMDSTDAGDDASRMVQVEQFDAVAVGGAYDVTIVRGDTQQVEISGPANVIEGTQFRVEDGRLRILAEDKDNWLSWSRGISADIRIVTPAALREVSSAGASEIEMNADTAADFVGKVAGAGELEIAGLDSDSARFGVAGAGDLYVSGTVGELVIGAAGSSDVDASSLVARTARLAAAGSSDIDANVTGTADIRAAGASDVRVKGGADCTTRKAGASDISCQ